MRKQIRKLILEGYQELHRHQSRKYKSGDLGGLPGPISSSPSKKYHTALRSHLLNDKGINSRLNPLASTVPFDYTLNNGHSLNVARSNTWPGGFSLIRQSFWNALVSSGGSSGIYSISFSVTGIPDIDAEFIARLCALSDDDFLRIATKTKGSARIGSWESEIMQGYPRKFIGM